MGPPPEYMHRALTETSLDVTYPSPYGPTGLVEDDGFMAGILMMKNMLNYDRLTDMPLHDMEVDVGLQWGQYYPLALYVIPEDDPLNLQGMDDYSYTHLLYMDEEDMSFNVIRVSLQDGAQGQVLSRKVGAQYADHYSIASWLWRTGLGPIPYVCRPGVAIQLPNGRVGCIIPHDIDTHGCDKDRCYFCKEFPCYSMLVDPDQQETQAIKCIEILDDLVIRTQTPVLLHKGCKPLRQLCRAQRWVLCGADAESDIHDYIMVYMCTQTTASPVDGMVAVRIEVRKDPAVTTYADINVSPWDLRHAHKDIVGEARGWLKPAEHGGDPAEVSCLPQIISKCLYSVPT